MTTKTTRLTIFGAVSLLAMHALAPARAADQKIPVRRDTVDLNRFLAAQDREGPAGAVGYTAIKGAPAKGHRR